MKHTCSRSKGWRSSRWSGSGERGSTQYAGGFVADLETRVAKSGGDVGQTSSGRLCARQVVGDVEGRDGFATGDFVHGTQGDLLQVDICTDT